MANFFYTKIKIDMKVIFLIIILSMNLISSNIGEKLYNQFEDYNYNLKENLSNLPSSILKITEENNFKYTFNLIYDNKIHKLIIDTLNPVAIVEVYNKENNFQGVIIQKANVESSTDSNFRNKDLTSIIKSTTGQMTHLHNLDTLKSRLISYNYQINKDSLVFIPVQSYNYCPNLLNEQSYHYFRLLDYNIDFYNSKYKFKFSSIEISHYFYLNNNIVKCYFDGIIDRFYWNNFDSILKLLNIDLSN